MPFPLAEDQLVKSEKVLGRRFPNDYRSAMQGSNGGDVSAGSEVWFLHPLQDTSDRKRISRTANHVVYETNSAQEWSGFPVDAVSIAADGSGNHLVFLPSLSNPDVFGATVFRWDHETRELSELGSYGELIKPC